ENRVAKDRGGCDDVRDSSQPPRSLATRFSSRRPPGSPRNEPNSGSSPQRNEPKLARSCRSRVDASPAAFLQNEANSTKTGETGQRTRLKIALLTGSMSRSVRVRRQFGLRLDRESRCETNPTSPHRI